MRYFILSLFILLSAYTPALCSRQNYGVDDWTAEDFRMHFKDNANVDVPASAIAAAGLHGTTFFAAGNVDLSALRLQPAEQAAAKQSLEQLFHRVHTNPVDFWEWRAANRQLVDNWIAPLAVSPRALLIWMRYFCNDEAINNAKHPVDDTHFVVFFLQWNFVPHYPLYRVVSAASDDHSYYDELVQFAYAFGVLVDVVLTVLSIGEFRTAYANILCTLRIGLEASDAQFIGHLIIVAATYCWSFLCYYVLWSALPLFINTILFDLHVAVAIPVMIVGSFYFGHLIAAEYLKRFTKRKKFAD